MNCQLPLLGSETPPPLRLRAILAWGALCAGLVFLGACQSPPGAPSPVALPSLPAPPALATRYAIRPDLSEVRFLVYRAGPFAALGHNHVIQAKTMTGEIFLAADFHQSTFSLALPVAGFQVDARAARREEGEEFTKLPEADAIVATTANLLGDKVLDARRYPQIDIRSVAVVGPDWAADVAIRINLRGVVRDISVPVTIERRDDRLIAMAVFEVNQTDFGITPLSVFGGAIQVANTIKVRLRIVAQKA